MQQAYISKDPCAVKKLKSSVKSCEVAPIFALHFFTPRQATFPSNGLTSVDGRGNSLEVRDSLMSSQKQPAAPESSTAQHILVIDDDVELCELVAEYLKPEGFEVDAVHSGTLAVEKALSRQYSLLVLDVMLPGVRGFEVLKKIRAQSRVPVIMLTARGDEVDRILGLEFGADDYLPKPFNPRELTARVRAVLRRGAASLSLPSVSSAEPLIRIGDIELDPGGRSVRRNQRPVELTAVEFDLLRLFLQSPGVVLEREQLSREILGRDLTAFDRSMDVHVSNLRRKLGPNSDRSERIKAIRSVGYLYTVAANPKEK
jgi:two-component system response regulator CpxR